MLIQQAKWVQIERLRFQCIKMCYDLKLEHEKEKSDQNKIRSLTESIREHKNLKNETSE